jgi:hypothetical protein
MNVFEPKINRPVVGSGNSKGGIMYNVYLTFDLSRVVKPSYNHLALRHGAKLLRLGFELGIEKLQSRCLLDCLHCMSAGTSTGSPGAMKARRSVWSGISLLGRMKAPIANSLIVELEVRPLSAEGF